MSRNLFASTGEQTGQSKGGTAEWEIYLNTLGVAQYRAGQFNESVATLE
jgi:hypothetical protein